MDRQIIIMILASLKWTKKNNFIKHAKQQQAWTHKLKQSLARDKFSLGCDVKAFKHGKLDEARVISRYSRAHYRRCKSQPEIRFQWEWTGSSDEGN